MKVSTNRIRIELTFGALTIRELATRCGQKHTGPLHPFLSQMQHRTKEIVALPGVPKRYALRRQQTALARVWK